MNDVMKKRLIGVAILVLIGVSTPLLLSRCMHSGQNENGRGSMRVYNVQPDGKAELAGNADDQADAQAHSSSGETSSQQAASGKDSGNARSDQENASQPSPDAVSPQSKTDFSTPPVNGNTGSRNQADTDSQATNGAAGTETASVSSNSQQPTRIQSSNAGSGQKNDQSNAGSSNDAGSTRPDNDGSSNAQSGSSLQKTDLSGWVVQVASFGKRNNAVAQVRDLKGEFRASLTPGQVNGKTWYRVNVGPFKNKDAARAAARRLKQQGHGALVRNLK